MLKEGEDQQDLLAIVDAADADQETAAAPEPEVEAEPRPKAQPDRNDQPAAQASAEPMTAAGIAFVDPTLCTISPVNGRYGLAFDPVRNAELVDDIRRQGQRTPVVLRAVGYGYELIAGTRRLGAVLELRKKLPDIQLHAHIVALDDREAWAIADAENAARRDLTPIQRARSWGYAVEHFHDKRQDLFAAAIGKDASVVSRTLALLDIPQEVLGALRDPEGVSVNFAAKLIPALAEPERCARIIKMGAGLVAAGATMSGPMLLDRLLRDPEEIAAAQPVTIALGDAERQASFTRNDRGGATLIIKPVGDLVDDKSRRAFLKEIERQLRDYLKL